MNYTKGMKIKTLEDCELPHDMRAETFTIVDSSQSDSLQVEDERGRVMVVGKSYIDERATKKLNQTKEDFNKKLEFDEVNVNLAFLDRLNDIFISVSGMNDCVDFNITPKEAKKLIKHLKRMVEYVEE